MFYGWIAVGGIFLTACKQEGIDYNAGTSDRAPFVCQLELSGSGSGSGWLGHSVGKVLRPDPGAVEEW